MRYNISYATQLYLVLVLYHRNGRLMTDFIGHGGKCVKRRAALSVKANPNCADKAEEYIEAAFERCYKDTYPFDRHPNLR